MGLFYSDALYTRDIRTPTRLLEAIECMLRYTREQAGSALNLEKSSQDSTLPFGHRRRSLYIYIFCPHNMHWFFLGLELLRRRLSVLEDTVDGLKDICRRGSHGKGVVIQLPRPYTSKNASVKLETENITWTIYSNYSDYPI